MQSVRRSSMLAEGSVSWSQRRWSRQGALADAVFLAFLTGGHPWLPVHRALILARFLAASLSGGVHKRERRNDRFSRRSLCRARFSAKRSSGQGPGIARILTELSQVKRQCRWNCSGKVTVLRRKRQESENGETSAISSTMSFLCAWLTMCVHLPKTADREDRETDRGRGRSRQPEDLTQKTHSQMKQSFGRRDALRGQSSPGILQLGQHPS